MYDEDDGSGAHEYKSTFFPYWRDIFGNLKPVETFIHNGRVVPRPPLSMTEPEAEPPEGQHEEEESASYLELEDVVFSNLDQEERMIARLAMVHRRPNGEIAAVMGVSRPAICQRLRRLAGKNQAVKMWWRRKNKVNQHE